MSEGCRDATMAQISVATDRISLQHEFNRCEVELEYLAFDCIPMQPHVSGLKVRRDAIRRRLAELDRGAR